MDNKAKLNVREYYAGKNLLLTGCTGFIGKVLLYNILTNIPKVGTLYITIRKKNNLSVQERLKKELQNSLIFQRLSPEWREWAFSKMVAVQCDISRTDGDVFNGCTPELMSEMRNRVNVLIHCAATVSFFERLDLSIRLNVYGTERMLEFAKTCKNMEAFNYVSTMFSNAYKPINTRVHEKLYTISLPNGESIEDFCARVVKMQPKEVEELQRKYTKILNFPNTYTFTKNMSEYLVWKNRGHLSVCINRPSVVGASYRDPFAGWVDTVSAAGAIYFFIGLGVTKVMWADKDCISDQIPVDFVCNGMLVSTCEVANTGDFRIYAMGSSNQNPITWGRAQKRVLSYFQSHPPKKSKFRASTKFVGNKQMYIAQFELDHRLTHKFYGALAKISGNSHITNEYLKRKKQTAQSLTINRNFHFFCTHGWIFDNVNWQSAYNKLSPEERNIFEMDVTTIDWEYYISHFCYGLHKYVMKEKPTPARETNIVDKDDETPGSHFSDVNFALNASSTFKNLRPKNVLQEAVLSNPEVIDAMKLESQQSGKSLTEVRLRALAITNEMFADPSITYVKTFSYLLRKVWRRLYKSIIVDDGEMLKIRKLFDDPEAGPLIIIPTHRSYIDFLIMSYVFFSYNLPIPHIAAGEDFLNMFLVKDLFRASGAFFLKRSFSDDPLYKKIFQTYLIEILQDNCPLEFFVEGTRSRANKTLQPKFGVLSVLMKAYDSGKIKNMTVVPISISYERVLESEAYSNELLGQSKTKESLTNLLKASSVINNNYGDIYIRFAEPISVKDYVANCRQLPTAPIDRHRTLVQRLGFNIAYSLNHSQVIMPSSLIASLLLFHRKGLSKDDLLDKVLLLKKEVKLRGGKVHWFKQNGDMSFLLEVLKLMGNVVLITNGAVEPNISKTKQLNRWIQLSIYRNQVLYLFVREAIVLSAFESFGQQGVARDDLARRASFLRNLLHCEFIYRPDESNYEDYDDILDILIRRKFLTTSDGGKTLSKIDSQLYVVLCNMIWSLIDTYYVTATAVLSLKQTRIEPGALIGKIQWLFSSSFKEGEFLFYESISMDTIKNSIQAMLNSKVLTKVVEKKQVYYTLNVDRAHLLKLVDNVDLLRLSSDNYKELTTTLGLMKKKTIREKLKNKFQNIRSNM